MVTIGGGMVTRMMSGNGAAALMMILYTRIVIMATFFTSIKWLFSAINIPMKEGFVCNGAEL